MFLMAMYEGESNVYIKCELDHCYSESDTKCTTVSLKRISVFLMAMYEGESNVYIKCELDHCYSESDTKCTTVSL